MPWGLLAAAGAGLGLLVLSKRKKSPSVGAITVPAPWNTMTAAVQRKQTASSGREYLVTTWPPDSRDRVFVTAISTRDPSFGVSFIQDRKSGARTLHTLMAEDDPVDRAALLKDWGLTGQL